MVIYDQEKDDGIDINLLTKGSISYASHVEPCDKDTLINDIKLDKSIAGIQDKDLYYVQSILVTSNWNKNDDIFAAAEIWKAKETPEDKPTNLEHDESIIIGHITSNQPITDDGKLIDPETSVDELPEKFHILTGSVVYLGFTQDELSQRANKLVAEIEDGTKYVSMECFFNDFDYGLIDKSTGEYKVLGRDNDSAYLTKYLKAYGGKGEYENYQVGRVLRNITFSGKGFVDKPANDNSIIFSKSMLDSFVVEKNTVSEEKGVVKNNLISTKSEKLIMSQETSVESLEKKFDSFVESQTKASDFESQVEDLTTQLEVANQKVEALESEKAEKHEEDEEKATKEEEAKKEAEATDEEESRMVDAMKEELAQVKSELEAMKEEKATKEEATVLEARMKDLADAGVAEEDTEALLALSDEQFASVVALIKSYSKPVEEEEAKKHDEEDKEEDAEAEMPPALKEALEKKEKKADKSDKEDKAEESVADAEVLEQVEFEDDVSLAVSEEDSAEAELQSTRAALIDFVKSRLEITK